MGRLLSFWSLHRREKQLFCEAALLLLLSYLGVKTIPFRYIDDFLRAGWNNNAWAARDSVDDVKLTRRSLARVSIMLPLKDLCLSQSIAAFIMLRRRGIPVTIVAGVRSSEDSSLHAHAWIETGLGEPNASSDNSVFTPVLRIGKGL